MQQFPKKTKYRKYQKHSDFYIKTIENKCFNLTDGEYGIQSLESGKIQYKQMESCRKTFRRGRIGRAWIKVFTNVPITKKPVATRMGKGKGNLSHWVALIKKGQILFEICEISNKERVYYLLKNSKNKLPLKNQK